MNTLKILALLLVLVVQGAWAGVEKTIDGELHIMNGDQPEQGTKLLVFDEVWRAGGEDGDDFFGLISQVAVGEEGNIYLLDTRLSEVPVYSTDGERLDTISREGEGPGETRNPSDMLLLPGGKIGLVQSFPGKVTMLDLQGNPQGVFQPVVEEGGFLFLMDCRVGLDGQLTATGKSFKQAGPTSRTEIGFVSGFDSEGSETVRYVEIITEMDFTKIDVKEDEQNEVRYRCMVVAEDGRVYLNRIRNQYQIEVYHADGTLDRIIEREFVNRPRSEKESRRINAIAEAQLSQVPGAKFAMSEVEPAIGSLTMGPDGNLWVSHSRSGFEQPEGRMATYDVFDKKGNFIKQMAAQCEGDGIADRLFWTKEGSAVLVTGFTDALNSLMSGGAGATEEEDEEAAPMEIIYLKLK